MRVSWLKIWNSCMDGAKTPSVIWMSRATFDFYRPYRGRRGPKTFTGTPQDVVRQMRRWQKGLRP